MIEIFVFSEIVDKIDKDGNDNVTKTELRSWMEYIQLKYLRDEVDKRWSPIDTDGDGMISWDEFKERHYGHKMVNRKFHPVDRKIAKKVDINGDGELTQEELKKWVQENHMKYLLKNTIAYIADVDINNDSKMSFKEYEESHFPAGTPGMPKNFRNTTRYQHGKRRFEYADLNKDGHLTMHEFLYFLNPEEGKHMRKCIVL
ncbi:Calumenin, partial [Paramuricea clavata]